MPAFSYRAIDSQGRTVKGVAQSDSARLVRLRLREQGLLPESVREVREKRRVLGLSRGIASAHLALLTRQLATLLKAGVPLEQALLSVAKQAPHPRVHQVLTAVRGQVLAGQTLTQALGEFAQSFNHLYCTTVAAGEQVGRLGEVLERLADTLEAQSQLRQKLTLALLYPITLSVVAIAVVIALLTFVVPEVVSVFAEQQQRLPWLTQALLWLSHVIRQWGWLVLLLGMAGVALTKALLNKPAYAWRFAKILERLPVLGRVRTELNSARFLRTLHILLASGVPLLDALSLAGGVIKPAPMRAALKQAAEYVREGQALGSALEQTGYFAPMVLSLVQSGEASGQLAPMLERAALNQEQMLQNQLAMLMALFEPLLIVLMGAAVLVIVLAILLPIFALNQMVF